MNPLAVCVHQSHGPIKSLVVLYGKLRQRPQLTCMVGLGEPLPSPLPAEPSSKCAGDDAQRSQKAPAQPTGLDLKSDPVKRSRAERSDDRNQQRHQSESQGVEAGRVEAGNFYMHRKDD